MRTYAASETHSMAWRASLRRHVRTCAVNLIFLLAVLPAAHADEEEAAPPEHVLWGVIAFVIVLAWILFMCSRAPRALRKKMYQTRRQNALPKWLGRILFYDPRANRLPTDASRQVRRAFERRRK